MIRTLKEAGAAEPITYDEWESDALPNLQGYGWHEDRLSEGPRNREWFLLQHFYANGWEAKLVSIFRTYREGELILRTHRLPRDELGGGATLGTLYRFQDGRFEARERSAAFIERLRMRKQAMRRVRTRDRTPRHG